MANLRLVESGEAYPPEVLGLIDSAMRVLIASKGDQYESALWRLRDAHDLLRHGERVRSGILPQDLYELLEGNE